MPVEGITAAQLTTVGGIAIVVTLIDQLIWTTTGATDAIKARFGPIVGVVTGIVIGVIAGIVLSQTAQDLFQSGLNGLLGGFAALGLYDTVTSKAGLTS